VNAYAVAVNYCTGNIRETEKFAQTFPQSSYALTQLAVSSFEAGHIDEAMDVFKKIRQLDRHSSEVSYFFIAVGLS
jgi:hypothetical protein